jgi:acetyltransferase-like isoleucine patch superfamily enzyme
MIDIIRYLYWDISSAETRDQYISYIISNIPGRFGIAVRREWYNKRFKKCGNNLEVCDGTIILNPQNIECGYDVTIGRFNYIQAGGGLTLGSDVILGAYVKTWTQNHNYKDYEKPVREQGYTFKPVELGRDVWIGANVFIMPGAKIGAKSIIAGSSVVIAKEYPGGNIFAGNPARKIGERKPAGLRNQLIVI